jgi:hypothetical protein
MSGVVHEHYARRRTAGELLGVLIWASIIPHVDTPRIVFVLGEA